MADWEIRKASPHRDWGSTTAIQVSTSCVISDHADSSGFDLLGRRVFGWCRNLWYISRSVLGQRGRDKVSRPRVAQIVSQARVERFF